MSFLQHPLAKKVFAQKDDLLLNRNIGTFAWVLHRVTGLVLASYIFLHLIVLGSNKLFGDNAFNLLMGQFEVPIFKILELCLVGVILFHGFNGGRIVIADFARATRLHKLLFWIIMVIFIIAMIITSLAFLPHIVK